MAERTRDSRRISKSSDKKVPRKSGTVPSKPEARKSGRLQIENNASRSSSRGAPASPKRSARSAPVPEKPSSKKNNRKSARNSKPVEPKKKLTREERQLEKENQTSKKIIIIASIVFVLLIGLIVGQTLMMNSRINSVKMMSSDLTLDLISFFDKEPIKNISSSGSGAISRLVSELNHNDDDNKGSVTAKANLIAAIAYTYYANKNQIPGNKGCREVAAFAKSKDEGLKKIAIQSLGYIPDGANELHILLKSNEIDAKTSMIALDSLPKSGDKIKGDILVVALKKKDPEFLRLIFPLIEKNLETFKEEPEAVRTLLKLTGHPEDDIKHMSISLLSRCIYKLEHFKQLQNDAMSEDASIRKAALDTLLNIEPDKASVYWGELLATTRDKQTQLQLLTKLGDPSCNTESGVVLKFLDGEDQELILEAIIALGKMENPPDKGVQKIRMFINHPNDKIHKAAIVSVGKFKYLKPFRYDKPSDLFPFDELIAALNNKNDEAKNLAIISLEKISGKKFITNESWEGWWKGEKEVLDKLTEVGKLHDEIKKLFDNKKHKEAKEAFHKLEDIFNNLREKHTRYWQGFDEYLEKKGNDFNYLKSAVYKHSPVN